MFRAGLSRAAAVLVIVLAAAACGGTTPTTPRLTLTDCKVQEQAARCGTFAVAENPDRPEGRTIHLRVVVLPATTTDRAPDPLFYFEGGPGGAATDETAWARSHFFILNQHHDIVLIDQRGTGKSNQTLCLAGQGGPATEEALAFAVEDCVKSVKDRADPTYYTTPISVDDFDRVRAALGYEKIDLYGISYGVSSGLAYVQRHGDHVRAAVFDSGSMLDYHIYEQVPHSAWQSLQRLFERCAADTACRLAYPNLPAEFQAILRQAIDQPVRGVDAHTLLNTILSGYLAVTQAAAALPHDIHAAARGDWSFLANAAQGQADSGLYSTMSITVRCSDEWASTDSERTRAAEPGSPFAAYEAEFLAGYATICKYWPHGTGASGRVTSSAPIVFLNSTTDPVDPPENVASAKPGMPNSLVVEVNGLGHWQLENDVMRCLDDEVASFIEAGRPPTSAQWSCAASPLLPAFALE